MCFRQQPGKTPANLTPPTAWDRHSNLEAPPLGPRHRPVPWTWQSCLFPLGGNVPTLLRGRCTSSTTWRGQRAGFTLHCVRGNCFSPIRQQIGVVFSLPGSHNCRPFGFTAVMMSGCAARCRLVMLIERLLDWNWPSHSGQVKVYWQVKLTQSLRSGQGVRSVCLLIVMINSC